MRRAAFYGLSVVLLASLFGLRPTAAQDESGGPSLYGNSTGKRRVYVTDSNSWSLSGGFAGSSSGFGGGVSGGARPQTAEVIKTFGKKCPGAVVTINRKEADFVVLFDHEGGKGWARKDNKIAIFNRNGDAIFSTSTRSLGSAVEDGCKAMMKAPMLAAAPAPAAQADAPSTPAAPAAAAATDKPAEAPAQPAPAANPAPAAEAEVQACSVFVKSTPDGADITVDGNFVGNTPSNLKLPPGNHKIAVQKSGFKPWERTMTVMAGGSVTLDATLDKSQ
jgi:PEGA domain